MSNDTDAECILEPVQLDILIEEIVLGPESLGWFEEIVKSIAIKYNQNFMIRSSNMNAESFF